MTTSFAPADRRQRRTGAPVPNRRRCRARPDPGPTDGTRRIARIALDVVRVPGYHARCSPHGYAARDHARPRLAPSSVGAHSRLGRPVPAPRRHELEGASTRPWPTRSSPAAIAGRNSSSRRASRRSTPIAASPRPAAARPAARPRRPPAATPAAARTAAAARTERRRLRRRRLARPARDVHRDVQLLRQRRVRPVPAVRRQAGLLLRLLQPALVTSAAHTEGRPGARPAAFAIPAAARPLARRRSPPPVRPGPSAAARAPAGARRAAPR